MIRIATTLLLLVMAPGLASFLDAQERQMDLLETAPGFEIEVWVEGVENARGLARGDKGTLFVGSRRKGLVHAVSDTNGDGKPDKVRVIASDLSMPTGVAFKDGALYVGAIDRILRFDDIEARLDSPPAPVVINGSLPDKTHHGWKFLRFGPDGKLYVPVGAPCNVCDVEDPFATILAMDKDTGEYEVFVRGVRNTVGFDWHPETKELWFTDNGRDMLGDDVPPDELNRVSERGQHFGFPFCHAGGLADPEFGDRGDCANVIQPAQELDPHVAALGMRFYNGTMLPERYRGQILIAEHGSWNRSQPSGYRIMAVVLDERGKATSYEPIVEGWLQGKKAWGRPADLLELPDGSLVISDDLQGVLYRLSYKAGADGTTNGAAEVRP